MWLRMRKVPEFSHSGITGEIFPSRRHAAKVQGACRDRRPGFPRKVH